jgi:solute carrier family 8 (sodium/calcium exchanger)
LIKAIKKIEDHELEVDLIVTGRHKQFSKWLREEMPVTKHKYGIWHVAKGMFTPQIIQF